jgi:hypothetical protein
MWNLQTPFGEATSREAGGASSMRRPVLLALILLAGYPAAGETDGASHSLTVTFDYNFEMTPACSATVTQKCVKEFVVYDLSAGYANRTVLLTIPVDPTAKGAVHGITGKTKVLLFAPGKHLISVVAQDPSNQHSNAEECVAWIEIK